MFTANNYNELKYLKKKWETFKLSKHATITLQDRTPLGQAYTDITGRQPSWSCGDCVADVFKTVMQAFDKYELEHVPNAPQVQVEQKTFRR